MGKDDTKDEYLVDAIMQHFAGSNANFVQSCITVRNMEYQKVSKIQNKGKLVDILSGQSNMISIAYHSRGMYNYMREKISINASIVDDDDNMEAISVYKI